MFGPPKNGNWKLRNFWLFGPVLTAIQNDKIHKVYYTIEMNVAMGEKTA